ncbi:PREDICTED: trihelix transcription factor GT-2-like [Nicotiana attenuata]|uniref:Trihelix transcription factor gt-2 n=1 Tax=Nicotiana attenuata TaxID=49451 RepID=A0A314L7R5_NICAT|nr:PREDICTED: trihelix transcription factor GT-2-like [Nicotiana attenuata]OIT37157.1 trihelix transcription factor gt-2 [Nicotiana attenuata]
MEILTDGDGHRSNDVTTFPDNNLTPFPVSTNAVYSHPASVVPPPPEIDHLPVSPARKLRPVRCGNGRSYVDMVDSSCDMDETLMNCSSDLGGFFNQFSAQNANTVIPRECGFEFSAVQQMKSVFDAHCFNLISQARILEAEFSSSSDDSESSEAIEERLNRKRKRETRKSLKLYLEDMVKRLMDKQEQMHKQLIDMIEKKEHERIIREEGWKQQEIERAKRDEEVRAEETSRNLALISFLENLLGDEFQIPKSSEMSSRVKDEGEVHGQEADVRSDPCNRRWPKSEVQDLVSIRIALDHKFLKGAKGSVWEEVADGLAKKGYIRTPKKCKEKWENINKYYKRTIDSGKACLRNYRSCPYFRELDILYKSHLLTQGTGDCVKSEAESKKAEE